MKEVILYRRIYRPGEFGAIFPALQGGLKVVVSAWLGGISGGGRERERVGKKKGVKTGDGEEGGRLPERTKERKGRESESEVAAGEEEEGEEGGRGRR